jgi:DNA-damage-inducible protein D
LILATCPRSGARAGILRVSPFSAVIEKAREACLNSAHRVEDHFGQTPEMVSIGSGAQRPVEDWKLSR